MTWDTTTNEEGVFALPRVPIGKYDVTIKASGFKTAVRSGIVLETNQRARVDVRMEIGALAESVQVTADVPLLSTDTTSVGTAVTSTMVVNAPLASRNYLGLTLLIPGVQAPDPSNFNSGIRSQSHGGMPHVNGNRKEANNYTLDGADANMHTDNLTSYMPNVDAIGEFKVITNNASAEFGNYQGGIMNVVLKSGTNDMHGDVFEFLRNDKLNANSWNRNWSVLPDPATGKASRTPVRWNQFGGTFGGPIQKNKLFYFMDYQGFRNDTPTSTSTTTVYPSAWRNGDFSSLASTYKTLIYDPLTKDANGNRAVFVNNQIPLSRRNVVASSLFSSSLYPTGRNDGRNNLDVASSSLVASDQFDVKVDSKLTNADDISVRYSWGRQDQQAKTSFVLTPPAFAYAPFQNGVVNWTRTLSPNKVNELRFGVNRIVVTNGYLDEGVGALGKTMGITGANQGGAGLPSIGLGSVVSGIGNSNYGTAQNFANNTFHLAENFTWTVGRHMMKMGGQLLRQQANIFFAGDSGITGGFSFDGHFTSSTGASTTGGDGAADFFLGYPSSVSIGTNAGTWGQRKWITGLYFQDDWRVNDELTLNLGLRWEDHTPLVEVEDRQSNFDVWTGQQLFAGKNGASRALYDSYQKSFQPRFGAAWTPKALHSKTVLRTAYGVSSFMEGTGNNLRLTMNPPSSRTYDVNYPGNTPGQSIDQGFSLVSAEDPYRGATLRVWDPRVQPSISQQWNFIIEHQLPSQMIASVGYIGQHSTHLAVPMPYLQRRMISPGVTQPSPYLAGNAALVAAISQISGTETCGNQIYHGMQASLRKRMTKGIEFQFNYVYSKGMTDARGFYSDSGAASSPAAYFQNLYNRQAEWGPTAYDQTHTFNGFVSYELPFGHGRQFGSTWNRGIDGVLGGWQVSAIPTLRTGYPLTVKASDKSGTNSRGARADRIGNGAGPRQVGQYPNTWLDRSAFKVPASGYFGTSGIGVVRGPGAEWVDVSVMKFFRIDERRRVELRGEAFGMTNTPIFGSPNINASNSTFGELTGAQGERNIQVALKFHF